MERHEINEFHLHNHNNKIYYMTLLFNILSELDLVSSRRRVYKEMAKLKSKFWFGGRSSSSPEATDTKPSIVIHLYHDMDAPIEKRMYTLETVDVTYTAEALCIEVAKHLNIGKTLRLIYLH